MATLIGSFNPKVINSAHMLIYFKAEMFYKKKKEVTLCVTFDPVKDIH